MLPSRAYVGSAVSQARVGGTGETPGTNCATGVMTDDAGAVGGFRRCRARCSPARKGRRGSRPARPGSVSRRRCRRRRGCVPKRPLEGRTSGSTLAGISEQGRAAARPGQVDDVVEQGARGVARLDRVPPPAGRAARSARSRPCRLRTSRVASRGGDLVEQPAILGAENIASMRRPVRARTSRSRRCRRDRSTRLRCGRPASRSPGPAGWPVTRCQASDRLPLRRQCDTATIRPGRTETRSGTLDGAEHAGPDQLGAPARPSQRRGR